MPNPNKEYKNRESLTDEEIDAMIQKAERIENHYFRLRSIALVSILKKFGKRRSEIASLLREDVKVEDDKIFFTFTIRKKHKVGFAQFLKWLEKTDPSYEEKSLVELRAEHKEWNRSHKEGSTIKQERRTKAIPVNDKYVKKIVAYLSYLDEFYPQAKYVFPSGVELFGSGYKILPYKHLTGRHLLNLIKQLNKRAWLHLFRDFVGGEIARKQGDSLRAVYDVKRTLDLENESTAMIYIERHGIQVLEAEEE